MSIRRLSDAAFAGATAGATSGQVLTYSAATGRVSAQPNFPVDNPAYATHNLTPSSFKYAKAAIAAARLNQRDLRIGCQGDSIAADAGAAGPLSSPFFARAATILGQRLGLSARCGLVPLAVNGTAISQWTIGSGWFADLNAIGTSHKFYQGPSGGTTGSLDFTPTDDLGTAIQADSFIIYAYRGGSAGNFQWSIDGGSYTTQTVSGSLGCAAYAVSAGTRGLHTLHIKSAASGSNCYILGAEAVDSQNRGIRYVGGGQSGSVTPTSYSTSGSGGDVFQAFGVDLMMFEWITNEYGSQAPLANFKANAKAVAAVPPTFTKPADVLWVPPPPQSQSLTIPQSAYYSALEQAADEGGWPVYNVAKQLLSYAVGNPAPMSLYADGTHPNDAGHNFWGASIASVLALL